MNKISTQKRAFLKMKASFVFVSFLSVVMGTTQVANAAQGEIPFVKSNLLVAQQIINLKGIIKGTNGEPIVGANVVVKGTATGTISDIDGNFSLNVPTNATIKVSSIGYITQEISIGNKNSIVINLVEDTRSLDEVVVVGYSVQKKVNLTGSVAAISNEKLEARPVTSTSTALQGLLPGVTVIQNSGQPGKDNSSIRVRGIGTLNDSNPMYVVDGMVVSTINDLDPNDIANISVLKDAASCAIYGSRAANGVILITTKKGGNKQVTVKYDGYFGLQTPTAQQEYLSSADYAVLYNKALINEGNQAAYTDDQIQKFRDGSDPDNYPNTDWIGLIFKDNAFQQSHRVEVSGGSEKSAFMISLGYLDQNGLIALSDFKRYNARANVSTQFKKWTFGMNLSYIYGDTQEPSNPYTGDMYQILRQANRIAPFVTNQYSNGYYGYIPDGNPKQWLDNGSIRNEKSNTFRGVGNVALDLFEGFKIQQTLSYEYKGSSDEKFIKDSQFYNWKTGEKTLYQGPNSQTDIRYSDMTVNLQTLMTYNRTFGKHTVGAIAGYSQDYYRRDWTKGYRKNFLSNDLHELNAGSADGQQANGDAEEYALQSYFGRLTYDYDNRYLFEANVRRDGTSRITKEGRWGTFPSFSGAWRVINESFMANTKSILSDLKLRAGWGLLGNQNVIKSNGDPNYYPYQSLLVQRNYSFDGKVVLGVTPVDGFNPNLKWETSESTNIGLDLGLLNNQLTLSADAYWRTTKDILLITPVSALYGLNAPAQNIGKVLNRGFEFQIGYKYNKGDFGFNALANMSYNHNEVLDLGNNGAKIWNENGYSFLQEGYPINAYGGYESIGLFKDPNDLKNSAVINRSRAGLGDLKYKNQNNDDKIDADDRVYLGSYAPKFVFGLSLDFTWKDFDLSMQFNGAAGVKGYVKNEMVGRLNGNTSKPTTMFNDCWDATTNPDGKFPRPLSSWYQNDSESTPSSFWIINASYLRMKNFQVGYTFPQKVCKFLTVSKVRVYYSGQNLLTLSGFSKGFDPEAPAGARAYYPQVKVNTIGLSVTF